MFNQTFIDGVQQTKKKYTVVLSLALQTTVLGVLILIPLIYTEVLPGAQLRNLILAPAPPPSPPREVTDVKTSPKTVTRQFSVRALTAPSVTPKKILDVVEAVAPDFGVIGSTGDSGVANGVPFGDLGSIPQAYPPPPPLPKAKPQSGPLRIGGGVAEAQLIHKVQPVYPALAKSARVQGVVEFTATISKDGAIENLQLTHGHPLLVNAAREAVLQWRYKPTLLNGQPVEVITDITVKFMLSQ